MADLNKEIGIIISSQCDGSLVFQYRPLFGFWGQHDSSNAPDLIKTLKYKELTVNTVGELIWSISSVYMNEEMNYLCVH